MAGSDRPWAQTSLTHKTATSSPKNIRQRALVWAEGTGGGNAVSSYWTSIAETINSGRCACPHLSPTTRMDACACDRPRDARSMTATSRTPRTVTVRLIRIYHLCMSARSLSVSFSDANTLHHTPRSTQRRPGAARPGSAGSAGSTTAGTTTGMRSTPAVTRE